MNACECGHAVEEHGGDPKFPGSMACTECDCIHYEEGDDELGTDPLTSSGDNED